jgi:hypothetical protein
MARGEGVRNTPVVMLGLLVLGFVTTSVLAQEGATGPEIVFFGVLRADDTVVDPNGVDESGRPVFDRPFGSGFSLVVEAKRGASAERVGLTSFSESGCPDLQIQVSRPLGDGSAAVCDTVTPNDGGVPAIDPPDLADDEAVCSVLNDLGCRFLDGSGDPEGRQCSEGCVLFPTGDLGCVSPLTEAQFCALVAKSAEFATGKTLVTARVRDVEGNLGPPAQIVIRIAIPTQTPTPTATPTVTPTPYVDDDACTVLPPDASSQHWPVALLLGLVSLIWLKARSKVRSPRGLRVRGVDSRQ